METFKTGGKAGVNSKQARGDPQPQAAGTYSILEHVDWVAACQSSIQMKEAGVQHVEMDWGSRRPEVQGRGLLWF